MKTIKNLVFGVLCTFTISISYSQTEGVSIKSSPGAPHSSAMLDIESSTKGLLIPRVNLLSITNSVSPVSNPTVGLLVYNLTSTVTGGAGFYYWNGSIWTKLINGLSGELWTKINVGGNPTNHIEYYNGNVRVGNTVSTTNPDYDLEVRSGTQNALSCLFESNGAQLRWGYNDYNGEAGGGPGNWLTQKTKTVSSTGDCTPYRFQPLRYVQMYEMGDWGIGITSWGKCKNQRGVTSIGTTNNNLDIGTPTTCVAGIYSGTVILSGNGLNHIFTNTGYTQNSDSTLKKNIATEGAVMEKLLNCRPVTYNMKSDATNRTLHGVIAQEISAQFPELVYDITTENRSETGEPLNTTTTKKSVNYVGLVSVLLKAIQEQEARINDLQTQIDNITR